MKLRFAASFVLAVTVASRSGSGADVEPASSAQPSPIVQTLLNQSCLDCHSGDDAEAGLSLESLADKEINANQVGWERVVRKLRARQMPPAGYPRPDEAEYIAVLSELEQTLEHQAREQPQPGRSDTFRRLTRFEYKNAIRDLLSLEVDVDALLPADEVSHGFDNITVGELSPTLLNRYISAAQKISQLAIGQPLSSPGGITVRVPADVTQEEYVEGLPLGTRGGVLIPYTFPRDGEYEISVRLTRDRNEHVEGLSEPHQLEMLLDSQLIQSFTVKPPRGKASSDNAWDKPTHEDVDRHLFARVSVPAGPHRVGVTFLKNPSSLLETKRQPLNVHYNMYRHPRIGPAVFQVSIAGPFETTDAALAAGQAGDSPSREKIFTCYPSSDDAQEQEQCAKQIISNLLRRATRRPVSAEDLQQPLALYRTARGSGESASSQGSFDDGIEMALSSILVNPRFLFRIENDPTGLPLQTPYRLSDLELATRLSFFLWSSIPDAELLRLAEQERLSDPRILEQQTRRMLADPRSSALVESFAGQWLYLRNLASITPDLRLYPDFDDNLRQAMREETELFFASVLREDRSVLDLIHADYTFLNERLAKHYGVPHVYGSRFRRVDLGPDAQRGGLLRQASVLTVTSYATRTSPVIRGKWILENILGTPPPPPPPDVPDLEDNTVSSKLPVRERLAQHRANPACASCHDMMDPVGFALENFDAVGRWRDTEAGVPVDASGGLPDGSSFEGVGGLEQGLLDRPQTFVGTMTEKLLTYALGRGLEPYDGPAVRGIVRAAEADEYRFSALILGIVNSTPFQMRMTK